VSTRNKKPSKKSVDTKVWAGDGRRVVSGRLVPGKGRPAKTGHLFRFVGEKLPYACLRDVADHVRAESNDVEGVYLAHDSMGVARYGGRGDIFSRLDRHQRKYPKELLYFSFFIIKNKNHEREIETAILRAAGSQMILNQRKVRTGLDVGNVADYEPGTYFIERQGQRGRKTKRRRRRRRKLAVK
jgi:hypothetical protein